MSEGSQEVTFSVVETRSRRELPSFETATEDEAASQALPFGQETAEPEPLPFDAEPRRFQSEAFPLAGPIVESATSRQLRGRCSSCDSKLRLRVKSQGPVTVRCPICGNRRRVEL